MDFGSGKGRVLLIASEFGFLRVCGVEFAHELCEAARKNCVKFKAIKNVRTEFQTVETDAAKYTVGADESVFVLYNPFDGAILDKVLDNIAISLQQQPRKILIVYYNPRWHHVIEQRNDFTRLRELSFWGYAFTLYSNRHRTRGGFPIPENDSVLTYHKIRDAGADLERDFYSVSRDFLVANIKAMLQSGYRELSLRELLAAALPRPGLDFS